MASLTRAFNVFKQRFTARAHQSRVFKFLFIRYPQLGGGIISYFKAAGADYFAQTQVDPTEYKKNGLNYRRNFLFGLLGFTHGGAINYFVHSIMNPRLFGSGKDPLTVFKIIMFNQFVYTPSFAFPLFYSYKGLVYSNGDLRAARDSLKLYLTQNIWKDVPMAARIWGPAHIVTYTLIPRRYRVYWINFVSFAWTTILSSTRGSNKPAETTDDEKHVVNVHNTNENSTGMLVLQNNNIKDRDEKEKAKAKNIPETSKTSIVKSIQNNSSNNNSNFNNRGTKQIEVDDNDNFTGGSSIDANNKIIDPGNDITPVLKKRKGKEN